jgi:uncharacterized protein involved in exopolysaccharide biosynthesis
VVSLVTYEAPRTEASKPQEHPAVWGDTGLWVEEYADEPPRRPSGAVIAVVAILSVIVVAAVTLGVELTTTKTAYGARAELIFEPSPDLDDGQANRNFITQEFVLASPAVLQPVAQSTGVAVGDLQRSLSVETIEQSQVIRVTVSDSDPRRAKTLLTLIVQEYEKVVADDSRRFRQELKKRMDELAVSAAQDEATLQRLRAARGPTGAPGAEERAIQARVGQTRELLKRLQDRLVASELRQAGEASVRVLTQPYVLSDPVRPQPVNALALGLLIGLFTAAGIVVALLWSRLGQTAR